MHAGGAVAKDPKIGVGVSAPGAQFTQDFRLRDSSPKAGILGIFQFFAMFADIV